MCRTCSSTASRLDHGRAPTPGDWFIEHAIGRRGVPVAYTVGLTGIDQPELIIRETGFSRGHRILHDLICIALDGPIRLEPGAASLGEGQDLLLRRYAQSIELTEAILRYDGVINVLQVVPVPFPEAAAVPARAAATATGPPAEVVSFSGAGRLSRTLLRRAGA